MALKLRQKKKIAVVFSGGGIKAAAFHIGVCLALREKGFKFAGGSREQVQRTFNDDEPLVVRSYVGSSAGSFVAAILSAGYSLESLVNAFNVGVGLTGQNPTVAGQDLRPLGYSDMFALNGLGLLMSLPRSLLRRGMAQGGLEALLKNKFKVNGLFTTSGIEKYLGDHALAFNEFKQLGVDLFIVGTQLNHSRKVIFGNFPEDHKTNRVSLLNYAKISQAVAASTSMPPVFAPYRIVRPDGKKMYFFDGEIRDTLSTHVAVDHGADLVISSYSIQPYHFTEEIGSLHKFGVPVILNQALYQMIQQKIERHIQHEADIRGVYNAIDNYFRQQNLPEEHREKVLDIIRTRVRFKPKVDYLYIHPRAQNHEMFFADHFSLNRPTLERIVRVGFRSAIATLRQHDI